MPTPLMTSSWLFPPRTREVQLDEAWSFVGKKQQNCYPADPADDHQGDLWDHIAYDSEHKLVLVVVPGIARRRVCPGGRWRIQGPSG